MQFLSDSQSAPTCDPKLSSEHTSLSQNDLDKLKVIAVRLNLQTRRGSYMTWRNKLVSTLCGQGENEDNVEDLLVTKDVNENSVKQDEGEKLKSRAENNELMIAKWQNMHKSIDFIHSELAQMRQQDQSLARQLVSLRNEMQQLKLQHSKQLYDDMVDDAQWTIAENEQLEGVCDEPRTLDKNPLLTIGITKMNLTERRFSVF